METWTNNGCGEDDPGFTQEAFTALALRVSETKEQKAELFQGDVNVGADIEDDDDSTSIATPGKK